MQAQKSEQQRRERLTLIILIALTAVGPLTLNIFIPSMPGLLSVFNTDYATVQLTLTLYLVATAIAQLFLGSLSDRFGRRPILLIGLILFLFGSIASALANSITLLIISRIVQAVGGCAGMVIGRAVVRDLYDAETAASKTAYIMTAMVVAPMLAPIIGGYLDVWFSWRAGFVFVTLFGAAVLLLVTRQLQESNHNLQQMPSLIAMFMNFALLLRVPLFRGYALVSAATSALFFAFLAGAPYIMVELLHRPPSEYGLYFVMVSCSFMVGSFLTGRLARRLGIDRMILVGSLLTLVAAGLLVALAAAGILVPMALFGPMMLVAIANGLSIPNSMTGALSVNLKVTGAASGLTGFLQIAAGALVTFIVGQLQDETQWPMVWVMFISSWLTILGLVLIRRAKR